MFTWADGSTYDGQFIDNNIDGYGTFYLYLYFLKVSINGVMEESLKEIGRIIRWREEAFSHGLITGDTKVNTLMTRKKDKEFSFGLMAENTKANGKTGNNMVLEFIHQLQEKLRKVNGLMESVLPGCDV